MVDSAKCMNESAYEHYTIQEYFQNSKLEAMKAKVRDEWLKRSANMPVDLEALQQEQQPPQPVQQQPPPVQQPPQPVQQPTPQPVQQQEAPQPVQQQQPVQL